MLTFAEPQQRTLDTPNEIAAYLSESFTAAQEGSPFKAGEAVAFASRYGLSPEIAVGDVGIMLCALPNQPWSWVQVFTAGGQQVAIQVLTDNLAKREAE